MSNSEDTFKRTMKTKVVLDLFRSFKKFQELIESGVDHQTAFIQAYLGIYYAAPLIPRPDAILTVSNLYQELKESHAYLTQIYQEAEEAVAYMEKFMKEKPPK